MGTPTPIFKHLPADTEREAFIAGECPACGAELSRIAGFHNHFPPGAGTFRRPGHDGGQGTQRMPNTQDRVCDWDADDLAAFVHRSVARSAGLSRGESWLKVLSPLPSPA